MKQFFTLLLVLCSTHLFALPRFAAAPTVAPTNFNASGNDGDRINVNWTSGNGGKRIVIARKGAAVSFVPVNGVNYGASAVFGAGNEVAPGEFVVFNATQSAVTPSGLQPSTQYFFAIYEYNGTGTDIVYLTTQVTCSGTTISAPTAQPTALVATNIIGNSLKLSWTNPTPAAGGGSGRIVLAREGGPVNVNPVDLSNYTGNTAFALGTQIGAGNYVLAETSSNTVTVTGLKPGTAYHFALFEYKGSSGLVYNISTPAILSATTLPRPTVAASVPLFSQVEGSSFRFSFTKGNGARRLVLARAGSPVTKTPVDGVSYTANSVFGTAATEIVAGSGEYVLADGFISDVTITGLSKATTYYFAVFEYDGSGINAAYFSAGALVASQATVSAPTVQASAPTAMAVQNNSATLSWQPGNGARRLVLMRKDGPVTATPVDLSSYGNTTVFGSGSQIGTGNYVVYNSTGNSATVTGLTAGATYHFSVFEYNGTSAPVYLTAAAPSAQFTTVQSPTQAANTFQWSNVEGNRLTLTYTGGNGTQRIVVLKAGSPVTGLPQNGVSYTGSTSFGNGDQIAPGEYVINNGNNSQVSILNLQAATTYYAAVFECNTVAGQPAYLLTPGATSQATVATPTVQPGNLQFSNVTGNSLKISWTAGNGNKRLVVVRAGNAVSFVPANFSYYNPNPTLGMGTDLGGNTYSVFSDNTNTVTLYNLATSTTYHVAVYEYNGTSYPAYLTTAPLTGSQQTADRPSVATTGLSVWTIEGNRTTVRWTRGNGTRRLVIASANGPVTAVPQDGIDYAANETFGSGAALLPGQFALQSGNETEVTAIGLQPGVTYHYAVFEYDGTGTATRYFTTGAGTISAKTLVAPAGGPANVLFASIGATTASINWTEALADRHLVVLRKGAPVTALPQQLLAYQASSFYGHSGSVMAPEHYIVFNGNGSGVNVTNLQSGSTYYVSVFAFNGNFGPVYNTTTVATASFTTLGPPTTAAANVLAQSTGASSATIRWTAGSGQKRLVLMRAGSPVTAQPADASLYAANSFFGSGQDLGNGTYAVYAGSSDFVTVSNLQKNQFYYIAVYEYNQFASGPMYLVNQFAQGQFNGAVLPVKLQSFSGVAKEGGNLLQWATAQEVAAAEFVVERSANATQFEALGRVAAAGNSTTVKQYGFEDKARLPVGYYRLKMVDASGKSEYSNVIRLQAAKEEKLKLFPTVASSTIQLSVPVAQKTSALLTVVDAGGRVQQQQTKPFDAGVVSYTMDVSRLHAGVYFLQVQMGEKTLTERFIRQ